MYSWLYQVGVSLCYPRTFRLTGPLSYCANASQKCVLTAPTLLFQHLYLQGMFWSKALPLESLYLQRFSGVQKVSHIFLPLNAASKPDQLKRLVFVVFLLVQKLSSTVVLGTLFWGKMPKNRLKKEAHENFLMLW